MVHACMCTCIHILQVCVCVSAQAGVCVRVCDGLIMCSISE